MPAWGQISSLSEISSVSLEFTYLARWAPACPAHPCAALMTLPRFACLVGWCRGQLSCPLPKRGGPDPSRLPAPCPRSISGHAAFERAPLAVHDHLEAAARAGGGLLGQFFNPLTGKASGKHGGTITLGALRREEQGPLGPILLLYSCVAVPLSMSAGGLGPIAQAISQQGRRGGKPAGPTLPSCDTSFRG
jgi:hypothetical protein